MRKDALEGTFQKEALGRRRKSRRWAKLEKFGNWKLEWEKVRYYPSDTSLVKPRTTVPKIPLSADTAIGTELPLVELLPTATVPSYKMLCCKGMPMPTVALASSSSPFGRVKRKEEKNGLVQCTLVRKWKSWVVEKTLSAPDVYSLAYNCPNSLSWGRLTPAYGHQRCQK